jgi:hypothetical protein
LGEFGDGAGGIVLEDAAGGMGCGSAGFEQGSTIDDENVGATELGKLPGDRDANDAGSDDDGSVVVGHGRLRVRGVLVNVWGIMRGAGSPHPCGPLKTGFSAG